MTATPYPRRLADGALPGADSVLSEAIAQLHRPPVLRCPHAIGGAAYLCAQHPAAGLLCWPCALAHTRRHGYDVEHRCDVCGAEGEWIHPLVGCADVAVLTTSTHGAAALYAGPVIAIALGVCPPCAATRGVIP